MLHGDYDDGAVNYLTLLCVMLPNMRRALRFLWHM